MRTPFAPPITGHAIITFDDGSRIQAEVSLESKHWYANSDYERKYMSDFNKAQPNAVHKIVNIHLMRN